MKRTANLSRPMEQFRRDHGARAEDGQDLAPFFIGMMLPGRWKVGLQRMNGTQVGEE
jgi:hypothetical protein